MNAPKKSLTLAGIALLCAGGLLWYFGRSPAREAEASELAPSSAEAETGAREDTTLVRHGGPAEEARVELGAEPAAVPPEAPAEEPEAATATAEESTARRIRVTVLDGAGEPVEGADVQLQGVGELVPFGRHEVRIEPTDAAGRTTIEEVPPRPVRVTAAKPGFAATASEVLRPPEDGRELSVELRLGVGGAVEGVLPGLDGQPAAGVPLSIHLRAWPGQLGDDHPGVMQQATTGPDGSFRFEHLTPGLHSIHTRERDTGIERAGDRKLEVLVVEGETTRAVFEDFSASFVRVEGQVLCNGEPVPEARISVGWAERGRGYLGKKTSADGEGRFEVVLDEGGDYRFQISRSGSRGSVFQEHTVPSLQHHALVLAYETGSLSGRVLGPDGQPVPDYPLVAFGQQGEGAEGRSVRNVSTDANGAYELTDLLAATYSILAGGVRVGRYDSTESPRPFLGGVRIDDIHLAAGETRGGVDIHLPVAGAIDVRVVDGEGRPVSGAKLDCMATETVHIQSRSSGATGASGAHRFGGLETGPHRVRAQFEAEISGWSEVEVVAGEAAAVELVLSRGTLVEIELRGGDPESMPRLLSAMDAQKRPGGYCSVHEGRATLGPLSPGRYSLVLPARGDDPVRIVAQIEVDGEPRRSLVIELP